MKQGRLFRFLVTACSVLFFSWLAHADSISITLTPVTQSGPAGTTVTFDATLTNLTTATIFLNGDSATTSSAFLTVNDSPFLANAPLWLAPGASSGPFEIFDVMIAPGATPGLYGLNSFSILGGTTSTDFNTVGSTQFDVNIAVAPEPGTLGLFLSGLLGLGVSRLPRFRIKT